MRSPMRIVLPGALIVLAGLAFVLRPWDSSPQPELESSAGTPMPTSTSVETNDDEMAAAARAFLQTLSDTQRARTQFPFNNVERTNWHYIPRDRKGLALADMTPTQQEAAHLLLRSALSDTGYEKTVNVVELEGILGQISGNVSFRDAEQYFLTVFGFPDNGEPWGWRFEGHHLSLNFSSVTDSLTATTPLFMGSNPAEVPSGPREGWRVLAAEEDLARNLLALLDDAQRTRAIISRRAPRDIITGADRAVRLEGFEGLPASAMTDVQKDALWSLIETYIGAVRGEWATARLFQLRETNPDSLFFAWAGGTAKGDGYYYRIHAPTLLIEYDNTQNDANHIHTVWRDPSGDWGDADPLSDHYARSRHHQDGRRRAHAVTSGGR